MKGEFLLHRRTELGLSQGKVAETLGYSTQTISLWENGKGTPNLPIWGKLAAIYQLDLEGLLSDSDRKENPLCQEKDFSPEEFALQLKRLRKKAGFTQVELAKMIGVPPNAIIRFEQGASFPNEEQFKELAKIYGVDYDRLYFASVPVVEVGAAPKKGKGISKRWVLLLGLAGLALIGGSLGIFAMINGRNARKINDSSAESTHVDSSLPSSTPSSEPTSETVTSTSSYEESLSSSTEESLSSDVESSQVSSDFSSNEPSSEASSSSSSDESGEPSSESSGELSSEESSSSSEASSSSSSSEPLSSSSVDASSSEESLSGESSSESLSSSSSPTLYTVYFDLDGGTSPSYKWSVEISELKDAFFYDVTKEDYVFKGWMYLGETIVDEEGHFQKYPALTEGMVFRAKWAAVTYPITYVLDGGTNNSANPASISASETISLEDASKSGYLFAGWYSDEEFLSPIATLEGSEIKVTGGITVYAKFTYNSSDPYNYPYLSFTKLAGNKASVSYSGTGNSGDELVLPSTITLDGVDHTVSKIASDGFAGLSFFSVVKMPSHLESIGARAFENCACLVKVDLYSSEGLTVGAEAFENCEALQFVRIGYCVNSIGDNAFRNGHANLVFLYEYGYDTDLGNGWNPDHKPAVPYAFGTSYVGNMGVNYMRFYVGGVDGYCAFGTSDVSNAEIPAKLYGLPVLILAENAFYGNSSLSSCTLPSSLAIISSYAFAYCTGLSSIYIPDSVDTILDNAFLGASSLTISCQADSQPSGWSSSWNPSSRPVKWNQ